MKRKIYDEILKWKKESNGKTALLIEGARRVGKSYIAEKFAKEKAVCFSENRRAGGPFYWGGSLSFPAVQMKKPS